MTERPRVLLIFPARDEDDIIEGLIRRVPPGSVDQVCLVDDGSKDGTAEAAERAGAHVIRHGTRRGVGAAIRTGIRYALDHGFGAIAVMAANGKDRPEEVSKVVAPVLEGRADYVQGSRWMAGGVTGNMPFYRRVATRLYPAVLSVAFGRRLTECTNGYRCYTAELCRDPGVDLNQRWLDKYELEFYLHYKALTRGYRYLEVPVSKVYPVRPGRPYSKIPAITGWWRMMRPVILLALGLRR